MPKVSTTVVATAKSVAEKAKKWVKMAILWFYYSHKGCLMAPRLLQHEYLLAPMIWCDFYHFRISGSIICRQLLHSFTDVMKGASPFQVYLTSRSWFFTDKSKKYTRYLTVLTKKHIWYKIWVILHHPKKFWPQLDQKWARSKVLLLGTFSKPQFP